MRKFILTAALVLMSATAQAGVTRGLTIAANDEPAATDQAKPAEAPKYVARPAAVSPTTQTPAADQSKPVAEKNIRARAAMMRKHRHGMILARLIYALHRHGIYW
jgi:hypothetical protein